MSPAEELRAAAPELSRDVRRLQSGRGWSGFLTLDNLDAVAGRLRALIGDGQPFTWVARNERLRSFPEVRTAQVASKIEVTRRSDADGALGSITVVDSYQVWGLTTEAPDEQATRGCEPAFGLPRLTFTRDQLQIEGRAPAGHRLYWVVAPEDRDGGEL